MPNSVLTSDQSDKLINVDSQLVSLATQSEKCFTETNQLIQVT